VKAALERERLQRQQDVAPASSATPQVIRVEVPQQPAIQSAPQQVPSQQAVQQQEEAQQRQAEMQWKQQVATATSRLRGALASYKAQVCQEARGQLAVSNTTNTSGQYIAARAEVQGLEESARLAGVPPGWYRINWTEFPEPESGYSGHYDPAGVASRWGCGDVTSWGH
jgi:hypothetical protein